MTVAACAARPGDLEYGCVCPVCAGPKHRQSKRCQRCYADDRRAGLYPDPPVKRGPDHPRWSGGPKQKGPRRYAAQPADHPWRGYWKDTTAFENRTLR